MDIFQIILIVIIVPMCIVALAIPPLMLYGFMACCRTQSDIERWEKEFVIAKFDTKTEAKQAQKEYNGKSKAEKHEFGGYILKRC